jgi:hypothetical protein
MLTTDQRIHRLEMATFFYVLSVMTVFPTQLAEGWDARLLVMIWMMAIISVH